MTNSEKRIMIVLVIDNMINVDGLLNKLFDKISALDLSLVNMALEEKIKDEINNVMKEKYESLE